jgi:hypothetical protein
MSALKRAGSQRVRAGDVVEIVDCGRASERTQGVTMVLLLELDAPPFNGLLLL